MHDLQNTTSVDFSCS